MTTTIKAAQQPACRRDGSGGPVRFAGYRRLFLAVFLVVFLGGVGVSGAQALWSSSATAVTTVTTGTWVDRTGQGWSMPLSVKVVQTATGTRSRTFIVDWSAQKPAEAPPGVSYAFEAATIENDDIAVSTLPADTSRQVSVAKGSGSGQSAQWNGNQIKITITPRLDGVPAKPTVVWITLDGSWAYDVVQE